MAQFAINRKGIFRLTAVALLAVCAGFTFPDCHYSAEKTFIKAPAPQTEICSLLADDIEDSNDFSTGAHFFNDFVVSCFEFPSLDIASAKMLKEVAGHYTDAVYLQLRQLLI